MRLFSYVVVTDIGFSPNPFHGYLTLACCKPKIRKSAKIGSWIVGTLSTVRYPGLGRRVLYAARITERLYFEEYWADTRFAYKKPCWGGQPRERCGDNIYNCSHIDGPVQLQSFHSKNDGSEDLDAKARDLGGEFVLVSNDFVYYGRRAVPIPDELNFVVKRGPGYKTSFSEDQINLFINWLPSYQPGRPTVLADPNDFEENRSSCCMSGLINVSLCS